jgi:hypothetical protein
MGKKKQQRAQQRQVQRQQQQQAAGATGHGPGPGAFQALVNQGVGLLMINPSSSPSSGEAEAVSSGRASGPVGLDPARILCLFRIPRLEGWTAL